MMGIVEVMEFGSDNALHGHRSPEPGGHGRGVFRCCILEDARDDEHQISGRTDRRGDAFGNLTGPVRPQII